MIKVNENDFKKLVKNVELIKDYLFSNKPYSDPEGELSDWAKKELDEARKIADSELISMEEIEKEFL